MSNSRIFLLITAIAVAAPLFITSCGIGSGAISAQYPTVAEMDRLDTQWGLPPRKSRGGPRRSYQVPSGAAQPAAGATAPLDLVPPARETTNAPAPAAATPAPPPIR